jgi:hypothetical protein
MATFLWALACERAIINNKSNNLSLIEIFEQFNVPTVPIIIPQAIYIVSSWEKAEKDKEETFTFKIEISQPDSAEDLKKEAEIEAVIPKDKNRIRNLCRIFGLKAEREGTVYFIISQKVGENWKEEYRVPLHIVLQSKVS